MLEIDGDCDKGLVTISKKIRSVKVRDNKNKKEEDNSKKSFFELTKRPDKLNGTTYKIKTPNTKHALYVTINNIKVHGKLHPFEIFLNSKSMSNFQWVVALTRVLSSVFRNSLHFENGATFLTTELQSVFDPKAGYMAPGGKWKPSLVAEIGDCLEQHLIDIGILEEQIISEETIKKRQIAEEQGMIREASQCTECGKLAVVRINNCDTCLECEESKCG